MQEMLFERRGPIAVLTVNRPERRNAMTWAMYERLVELCDEVDWDKEIAVWVLCGAGETAFISGTDISQFSSFKDDPRAGVEYEQKMDRITDRLATVRKPTIALIDGYAVGGGLMLALNCDLRVATPESKLSIPCAKLGNCLSMRNYAKLLNLIGPARTLELMYTARHVDAAEAQTMGLINRVVPRDEIWSHVMDLAGTIAQSAPLTLQVTKEAIRQLTGSAAVSGEGLIQTCYTSMDFQEGVAAFLAKRAPQWQGR